MRQTFCLFLVFITLHVKAQNPITFTIKEASGESLPGTTLKIAVGTKLLFSGITDVAGKYSWTPDPRQSYTLSISSIGYQTQTLSWKLGDATTFTLKEDTQTLQEVQVVGQKPLTRQVDDKTIVDPEPLVPSSTNALEILEKTPGLFVDADGNVYASSTSPATILINGREQRLGGGDLASVLRSLPPNSIESIEILRTPSAKYDASGGGGVINIILKKGVRLGLNGTITSSANQGRTGTQQMGLQLNHGAGKWNQYLNLNHTFRNNQEEVTTDRFLGETLIRQRSQSTFPGQTTFAGFGVGYEANDRLTFQYDGRWNQNTNRTLGLNTSEITRFGLERSFTNELKNRNQGSNWNHGLSGIWKWDSVGSEIRADVSWNRLRNVGTQQYSIQPDQTSGQGDIQNFRNFWALQLDLRRQLPAQWIVEAGVKSTGQKFDNQTIFTVTQSNQTQNDPFRTSGYVYEDRIHAAYAQASKKWGPVLLKTGVRMENTQMDGQQVIPTDTSFQVRRTDFFPYLYLSRKLMTIAGFELRSYLVARRTINRPAYELLNPFARFVDPLVYEQGNPTLRPQFTQNYEVNVSVDERPILAFGRNYTQDLFTNVVYQDPVNPAITVRTYDNLGQNIETYARILAAIPPGKVYFFVLGGQYNHNQYQGVYEGQPFTFSRGSWTFFTFHQFKFKSQTTLNINGFFRYKGQLQLYELGNFGNLNLTVTQPALKKKLFFSLNVTDIFFTNQYAFSINQGNIQATGKRVNDTRRVGLTVRYQFGGKKSDNRGRNPFEIEEPAQN